MSAIVDAPNNKTLPCNPAKSHCGRPKQTTCSSVACHKEPFHTSPLNLNPCVVLAVGSVPLSLTGVPEVAAGLGISAGVANVLGWTGVAAAFGGLACM
jgi:hypothetical protein